MPVIGKIEIKGQPLPASSVPLMKRSPYCSKVHPKTLELIESELSHRSKFGSPKRNNGNVMKSIKKMDQKPTYAWESNPVFWKAVALFRQYKSVAFTCGPMTDEETCSRLSLDKAGGFVRFKDQNRRCKDKEEVINHPDWPELRESREDAYWMVSPKEDEFKLLKDLLDGKIRTFIIPPTNLLYWQLRLFQVQNDRMKNHLWSAYGMNPFGGGVDRLAKKLLKLPYRGCLDWSGWDRLLPFLPYVYETRREFLILPDEISEDTVQWVIDNTVNSKLIDPDGDVFYKTWGNNSGTGGTTCDNICAAELVWIYALCLIDPSTTIDDLMSEVEFDLFGDDEQHAVSERYKLMCDENWLRQFATHLGLELKFFKGGYLYPLEELSFLGFHYRQCGNFYIPRFDDDKILHSLIHTYKTLTLEQYVSKIYALTVLSYGTDIFAICCRFYGDLLDSVKTSTDPAVKAYICRGVPTSQYLFCFYTQCEQSEVDSLLQNFLGPAIRE